MPIRALVAYSAASTHVPTTRDYLDAIKDYSGFDVDYIHVSHQAEIQFDFNKYDVVFHNYCARLCFPGYVSDSYQDRLRQFSGIKVLAVQDEYDLTNALKRAIKDLGFHIVLTCVPQKNIEYVYPKHEFPDVIFKTVLTGYVPHSLVEADRYIKSLADRPIVIGYRGRDIGGLYGRLGFEKFEIGRRMKEICTERGIPHDIAVDEESRIYGDNWFEFIGSCRAMLGSESGSNVFDFDGSIRERYFALAAERGGDVSYKEFLPFVEAREREIDMGQISPRVFEYAVMRTPMVLYRGRYSDALIPDEHYIPLEKDFSNIDDVLSRLRDLPALESLAERAYSHIVSSGQFGYPAFWASLRQVIESEIQKRHLQRRQEYQDKRPILCTDARAVILTEKPSKSPHNKDYFQSIQHSLSSLVYCEEVDRLTRVYEEHTAICMAEIRHLSEIYRLERQRTCKNNTTDRPNLPFDIPLDQITQLTRTFHAEKARFEQARAALDAVRTDFALQAPSVLVSSTPLLIAALLEARTRAINYHLDAFNTQYPVVVREANQLIDQVTSGPRKLLRKFIYLNKTMLFRSWRLIPNSLKRVLANWARLLWAWSLSADRESMRYRILAWLWRFVPRWIREGLAERFG